MTEAIRKYNNLTQRIITGLLGAAVMITAVVVSEWSYFAAFALLCFLTLNEFYALTKTENLGSERVLGMFSGLLIYALSFLVESGMLQPTFYLLIFPIVSLVFIIKLYTREQKPFTGIAFTLLGIVYVALPFALLNYAAFRGGRYNFEVIFGSLFILWATDTGAYFAGRFLGKRKLFERISPKKTWEGFFGGAALALVFVFILATYLHTVTFVDWVIIGILIIVGGTFGDLVESLLKRSIAIKDSGDALPGHGGFLDRFDGLLIAAPFIVAYLEIFS